LEKKKGVLTHKKEEEKKELRNARQPRFTRKRKERAWEKTITLGKRGKILHRRRLTSEKKKKKGKRS